MTIEAMSVLGAASLAPPTAIGAAGTAADSGFSAVLDGIQDLNRQMRANEQTMQQLALGETDNLHQVMMNLERTRLTFDLLLQVRNKTLEAYQELMRMQV